MVLEPRTRILRILQILQAETDADHPITIVEIIRELNEYIYDDGGVAS